VLAAVVRDHIGDGEPVGSSAIARRRELEVSAATVRAVMADLESLGFLEKPHTSAGRVPTTQGYRYYVDTLLRLQAPRAEEQKLIEQRAQAATAGQGVEGMLTEATRVLHAMTRHAGVVALPRMQGERLQRIELVALREGRVLAVLVTHTGAVQNRLLQTPPGAPQLTPAQLAQGQNWLNELLANLTLSEARARLVSELGRDRALLEETRARALALGAQAVELLAEGSALRVEGHSSLLEEPSWLSDASKVRTLLRALEEKQGVLALLERVQLAHGLTIFIGKESGLGGDDLSVVAAPYYSAGQVVGALGVLGPSRMDYARVVPLVEFTARTVGLALGGEG
jgi:heat-inducible transcriptional repressor